MKKTANRQLVAYHEAGHCVVANAVGLNVDCVSIEPRGDTAGHCRTDGGVDLQLAIVYAGGPNAELRYMKENGITERSLGWGTDLNNLTTACGLPEVCSRSQLLDSPTTQAVIRDASSLVRRNWEKVKEVAKHLEHYGTLAGEQLKRLLAADVVLSDVPGVTAARLRANMARHRMTIAKSKRGVSPFAGGIAERMAFGERIPGQRSIAEQQAILDSVRDTLHHRRRISYSRRASQTVEQHPRLAAIRERQQSNAAKASAKSRLAESGVGSRPKGLFSTKG